MAYAPSNSIEFRKVDCAWNMLDSDSAWAWERRTGNNGIQICEWFMAFGVEKETSGEQNVGFLFPSKSSIKYVFALNQPLEALEHIDGERKNSIRLNLP